MRFALILAAALLAAGTPAAAQVRIAVGLPSVSIGIRLGGYPELVAVPGYPVYYASQVNSNLFFYDGLYWVYAQDGWYSSAWYDGPWDAMSPEDVPYFVLRVPLRYYRQPPAYFLGAQLDLSPRWGAHWGSAWEQQHRGWDHWDHARAPAAAPLPIYQRAYVGNRYPDVTQQRALREGSYRYQPSDPVARRQYDRTQAAPAAQTNRPEQHSDPAAGRSDRPAQGAERAPAGRTVTDRPAQPAQRTPTDRPSASRESPATGTRAQPPSGRQIERAPVDANRGNARPEASRQQAAPDRGSGPAGPAQGERQQQGGNARPAEARQQAAPDRGSRPSGPSQGERQQQGGNGPAREQKQESDHARDR